MDGRFLHDHCIKTGEDIDVGVIVHVCMCFSGGSEM